MSDEPLIEQIKRVLRDTDARGFRLHKYGNGREGGDAPFEQRARSFNVDNIERAAAQVELLWDKVPAAAKGGSGDGDDDDDDDDEDFVMNATVYGMKHELEHFRDKVLGHDARFQYISSGDFAMAMLLCGFDLMDESSGNYNVRLRVRSTDGHRAYREARHLRRAADDSSGSDMERARNELKRRAAEWAAECKQADHYR